MRTPRFGLRALDILIIGIILALTSVSAVYIYGGKTGTQYLEIDAPGGHWVYDLETDRKISVEGPLGDTIIVIQDGHAHVEASPCANQTCVAAPDISHKGEWNACLPNEVMIRITGKDSGDEELDAIVY